MPLPLQLALAQARITGSPVAPDRVDVPESAAAAYAVQDQLIGLVDKPLVGWKIGATSDAVQARLGVRAPISGPMFEHTVAASGTEFDASAFAHRPGAEGEIVLRTKRDIAPTEARWSAETAHAVVDAVAIGIELVGSRFTDNLDVPPALIVADGSLHGALVHGAWVDPPAHDLTATTIDLEVAPDDDTGEPASGFGTGAEVLQGPYSVLAWLLNHLAGRNHELAAGSVISTGTCTGIVPTAPSCKVSVNGGELGSATLTLT